MTDITNPFPSWGETGSSPPSGFSYSGGDQVNEKHLDYLWDQQDKFANETITALEDRVTDLHGNVLLGSGAVVSQGAGTREVDVSALSAGAYVDGQRVGSVNSTSFTLSTNGSGSERTDVVWLDQSGTFGTSEGTTTVSNSRMVLAEVDVSTGDSITDVRNVARDHVSVVTTETEPDNPDAGDAYHERGTENYDVYVNGSWETLWHTGNDGSGSGLDADSVDGLEPPFSSSVSEGGSEVVAVPTDLNFGTSLNVTDDGDQTVTIDFDGSAAEVDGPDGTSHFAGSLPQFADNSTGLSNTSEGDIYYNTSDNSLYLNDGT